MKIRELELAYILKKLEENNNNKSETARQLGISIKTMFNKCKNLDNVKPERSKELEDFIATIDKSEFTNRKNCANIYVQDVYGMKPQTLGERFEDFELSDRTNKSFNKLFPETPLRGGINVLDLGEVVSTADGVTRLLNTEIGTIRHTFREKLSNVSNNQPTKVYITNINGKEVRTTKISDLSEMLGVSPTRIYQLIKEKRVSSLGAKYEQ